MISEFRDAARRIAAVGETLGCGGDAIQRPFGRVGTPNEVAQAVVYLTSPDAVWASAAIMDFTGASYLRT